jgi:hypothetical protein
MTLQNEQTATQLKEILSYMKLGNSITPMDALQMFGCMRLGARVYDLRALGFDIVSERRKFVNKYGHKATVCMYHLKYQTQ